jgi:ornithine cyclodeaminase/alanine dehydrogenase-like protein (mu-crystallin family)
MAIFLRESDIEELATMDLALEAVEKAFRLQGKGKVDNAPRRRCRVDKGVLYVMSASVPNLGFAGLKSYSSGAGETRFLVHLYDGKDGQLVAIMEANKLSQLRTGAASGVATKYMARENASKIGIFGTGWQARSQLEAVCAVRSIERIVAFGRNAEKCEQFCQEMTDKLGVKVTPAASAEEAATEQDILITITTAKEPLFKGAWLAPGTHVNAAGSNMLDRQEIDVETVRRSACVVVDSHEQAQLEAADLTKAAEEDAFFWEDARELGLVVTGEFPGREDDEEITFFKSLGVALEDVAFAGKIFKAAKEAGRGEQLPF